VRVAKIQGAIAAIGDSAAAGLSAARRLFRRRYAWSSRPLGYLHDIELTDFPFERAVTFPAVYTANTLVSSAILGLCAFLAVFVCAFELTRPWVITVAVTQAVSLGIKLVQRSCVFCCLVGREGIVRHRCFACVDISISLTIGAVMGLVSGLTRVLTVALLQAAVALRVDAPLAPRRLESVDSAFVSWAAMVRLRADAEAYGMDRDAVIARWSCIPRPLEVDVDEPWDGCPCKLPGTFGGQPLNTSVLHA